MIELIQVKGNEEKKRKKVKNEINQNQNFIERLLSDLGLRTLDLESRI